MGDTTIAGLARGAGVGVETVRYYQRRGLMPEPPRPPGGGSGGGVRRYGPEDVRRLRFIKSAQTAGFTLEEIGELLALDARIDELAAARRALSRLADQCSAGDAGPCPIISSFEPGEERA